MDVDKLRCSHISGRQIVQSGQGTKCSSSMFSVDFAAVIHK